MLKKIILVLSLISVTSCVQSMPLDQEKEDEITIQNIKNPKSKLMLFYKKHKLLIGIGVASVVSLAAGATIASFYYKNKETGLITLDMLEKQKALVDGYPNLKNEEENTLYLAQKNLLINMTHLFASTIGLEKTKVTDNKKQSLELDILEKEVFLKYRFNYTLKDNPEELKKAEAEIKKLKEKLNNL